MKLSSVLSPQSSILNPRSSIIGPESSILGLQSSLSCTSVEAKKSASFVAPPPPPRPRLSPQIGLDVHVFYSLRPFSQIVMRRVDHNLILLFLIILHMLHKYTLPQSTIMSQLKHPVTKQLETAEEIQERKEQVCADFFLSKLAYICMLQLIWIVS